MRRTDFPENDGFMDDMSQEPVFDMTPPVDPPSSYTEEDIPSHDQLTTPDTCEELSGDDQAMYSAGLIHPEDAEFIYEDTELLPQEDPEEVPPPDAEYRDEDCYVYTDEPDAQENGPAPGDDPYTPPHYDRPAHKGRPRHPKGSGFFGLPQLAATVVWLAIIIAVGVSLGRMAWLCASDVLAFGRDEQLVTVSITSSDSIETIADKLHEAGLIRYPGLFKLYADLAVDDGEISTGTFTLNTLYDYHALVKGMSPKSGNRKVVEGVLIPEGFTCHQIFTRLEEKGICKASELESYAANGDLGDYWFLEGVDRGDKYCLEGYLFPATYDFYENSTPKQVLTKMLDAFDANYSQEMQDQLAVLNERLSEMMRKNGCTEDYIAANQMNMHQVVTVASLIEKEMASEEESQTIASVIYNRLTQDEAHERYLNIDATIFYALDERKEALTAADLQIDSPYNTYTHTGLVPGPIASPGLACLKAALDPADTEYYYYVLDPNAGSHIFNKTYADHEKTIEQLNASRSTDTNG